MKPPQDSSNSEADVKPGGTAGPHLDPEEALDGLLCCERIEQF